MAETKKRKEKSIRRTTKGKGANYRSTKSGAGMTKKGVAAYKRKNPGSKLKTAVTGKVKDVSHFVLGLKVGQVKEVKQLEKGGNVKCMNIIAKLLGWSMATLSMLFLILVFLFFTSVVYVFMGLIHLSHELEIKMKKPEVNLRLSS